MKVDPKQFLKFCLAFGLDEWEPQESTVEWKQETRDRLVGLLCDHGRDPSGDDVAAFVSERLAAFFKNGDVIPLRSEVIRVRQLTEDFDNDRGWLEDDAEFVPAGSGEVEF